MTRIAVIRAAARAIAREHGIVMDELRPNDDPALMRFRTQSHHAMVSTDEFATLLDPAALHYAIESKVHEVQRTLFHAAITHIAIHDHDPLDRLKQLETKVRNLLDMLGASGRFGPLGQAVDELEILLRSKPGAASWRRDGYGKDPT